MKLTKTTEYALSALLQLDIYSSGEPVSSQRLARHAGLPERYFLQVLRSLVTHGLLKSTRGVVGGYQLERPLSEISLLQVIEVTDGPLTAEVQPSAALPSRAIERLRAVFSAVSAGAADRLSKISLADLVADEPTGGGDAGARDHSPSQPFRGPHLSGWNSEEVRRR